MMNEFQVAIVTGAQRGIGRAIALKAAAQGYAVAINFHEEEAVAEALAADISDAGGTAMTVRADMGDVASINAMVATVDAAWGRIDVLVNNAGIFPRVNFLDMREADWDPVLDINLKGTCFATIAAARVMIRGGRGGAVINMASSAIQGGLRSVHYAASKGGIVALTRGMAVELAPYRIRVNAIAPGLTNTLQPRQGMSEAELQQRSAAILLGRMAEPEDIAETAAFLMGQASAMITGQTVHINGGEYRP
jgi:NAD(P)-dependent dehydrogenase (short-subunit alcohol dehydrogenase family)